MLAAKGMDLGRSISGLNFDRRRVRILAPFGKIGRYGDWGNEFWVSNVDLELLECIG